MGLHDINIISWNLRGIRKQAFDKFLADLHAETPWDFLCLQEYNSKVPSVSKAGHSIFVHELPGADHSPLYAMQLSKTVWLMSPSASMAGCVVLT